jgi:hypothetical protein
MPIGVVRPPPREKWGWPKPLPNTLGINTHIWGNFEIFVPKNACAAHVSHFLSKKTKRANGVLTLRILETLLGHIATF